MNEEICRFGKMSTYGINKHIMCTKMNNEVCGHQYPCAKCGHSKMTKGWEKCPIKVKNESGDK